MDFSRGDAQERRMAEDETGEVPKLPPDARLESLDERLDRLQQAEAKRTQKAQPDASNQLWQQLFGQLIGAPIGGAVIGWGFDKLAELMGHRTFPLFFILMLFFGFGVGVRNIMRLSKTRIDPGQK
ncbi:MAG TPA: AtpZ/AtpI family protein [Sphingomicrobium sp.]|nr:AtpZ/AtpI family protein [Sphingomicrobium sp.]